MSARRPLEDLRRRWAAESLRRGEHEIAAALMADAEDAPASVEAGDDPLGRLHAESDPESDNPVPWRVRS